MIILFEELISNWDWAAILYSFVGSALLAVIFNWAGFFRWLKKKYLLRNGIRSYKKSLTEICSSLIVIGRRHGFSIKQVYIKLDLAPSDLMAQKQEGQASPPQRFVLLGGPGAGKSTLVKKETLDRLTSQSRLLVFFIKLREYDPSKPIDEFIADQLMQHRIPDALSLVRNTLMNYRSLCVLDGLDEVRPNHRDIVCNNINQFFSKFYSSFSMGELIVTCRKEAYMNIPLNIQSIWEVRPLTDEQIKRYAKNWPLPYPSGKNLDTFWNDLASMPRILELARSPLLLTGGLVQYTESNLGLPEERVEYLSRIGKWLVSEWATAQGHPPDPFRAVYSRILPKIAFEMHKSQQPDCASKNIIGLLEQWLPSYGYEKNQAKDILDNVMTKTGILVHDSPATVVFSQFGLQEFYASIEAIDQLNPADLAKVTPKSWWREVILLAIAQQKEPSAYLEELFRSDPLLAATAVTECPTPSIIFQERSIVACLDGIDKNENASRSAAVSILRKVKGQQEEKFINELETRLSASQEVSLSVGLILATAGTTSSTIVLTHHPAIWDTCLKSAGYLSNNFENLLVEWIRIGDERQSRLATDLIAPRLSGDRFKQLLNLLPSLPSQKSEYLAIFLLKYIESTAEVKGYFEIDRDFIGTLSTCIPFIEDKEKYLKSREKKQRRSHPYTEDLVPVSLFISKRKKLTAKNDIYRGLLFGIQWYRYKFHLLSLISATLAVLSFYLSPLVATATIFSSLIIVLYVLAGPRPYPPWVGRRYSFFSRDFFSIPLILIGVTIVLSLGGRFTAFLGEKHLFYNILLSTSYSLLSLALLRDRFFYWFPLRDCPNNFIEISKWIWSASILIALIMEYFKITYVASWVWTIALLFAVWLSSSSLYLFTFWRKVHIARNKMEKIENK
jgi:hypothetical protein